MHSENEHEKTEKKISTRKKRDPNAPKPATSAYQFFFAAMQPVIKQEMPDIDPKEIFKVLGQRWKALDDNDRKSYIEKADLSKQEYQEKLKLFKETGTCEITPASSPIMPSSIPVIPSSDSLEREIGEPAQHPDNNGDKKEKHKHKKKRSAEESSSHDVVSHEKKKKKKKKRSELAESIQA